MILLSIYLNKKKRESERETISKRPVFFLVLVFFFFFLWPFSVADLLFLCSAAGASGTTSSGQAIKFEGIRPGESMAAFNRRLKTEANKMLIEEAKKNSRKAEKRREYRQKKKEALIKKKYGSGEESEEEEPVKDPRTGKVKVADFSQLRDEVKFGEQAYEPPKFTRLPRMKAKAVGVDSGQTFEQKRAMDLMRDRIRTQLGAKKAAAQPSLSSIFRG